MQIFVRNAPKPEEHEYHISDAPETEVLVGTRGGSPHRSYVGVYMIKVSGDRVKYLKEGLGWDLLSSLSKYDVRVRLLKKDEELVFKGV